MRPAGGWGGRCPGCTTIQSTPTGMPREAQAAVAGMLQALVLLMLMLLMQVLLIGATHAGAAFRWSC
jgi:hypothetical protein